MIEVAAILSAVVGHWADLTIISLLLLFNAGTGFWQEYKASSALKALKSQLALKARVLRDGQWQEILAADLDPVMSSGSGWAISFRRMCNCWRAII